MTASTATGTNRVTGTLYVISAPSGAGKTSLVRGLVESDAEIVLSVSHTTREQRPGETAGTHYQFVSEEEFCQLIEDNAFLEHATVFGHRYGTTRQSVDASLDSGLDVLLEIDYQGAQQVRAQFPDSRGIFILPPSRDALRKRLRHRDRDSDAVIEQRLATAADEMRRYGEFDFLIVNRDFQTALAELRSIVASARLELPRQRVAHQNLLMTLLS